MMTLMMSLKIKRLRHEATRNCILTLPKVLDIGDRVTGEMEEQR